MKHLPLYAVKHKHTHTKKSNKNNCFNKIYKNDFTITKVNKNTYQIATQRLKSNSDLVVR